MRLLLDTNILIWHLEGSNQLIPSRRNKINDPENIIFVSIGSLWEIAIKISIKKLTLSYSVSEIFEQISTLDLNILPILSEHIITVSELPFYHRDPFDRMLIAQARNENLVILTSDKIFAQYNVQIL